MIYGIKKYRQVDLMSGLLLLSKLISYLFRAMHFQEGAYLMTGTCLVPPNDFTLQPGDKVSMMIDGIGTLENYVEQLN